MGTSWFLFVLVLFKFAVANRYNITLSDLISCKEYRISSGYVYRNFFLIENIKNDRKENETLRIKFYVMAQNNAHILLSPVDNAKKDDRIYEIVIGAGLNTFAAIRRNIGGNQLVAKKQNGILNAIDPTPILIQQYIGGELSVTIPGFVGPLLTYKDNIPLHIKYLSFSSYGTTPARWFYDCDGDKAAHLEMEKRNLTNLERLQQYLFANYSTYNIPNGLRYVNLSAVIRGVSLDKKTSIFKTRLELQLKWYDPKLIWNSTQFGNLKMLRSLEFNYWIPSLIIMNGAGSSWTEFTPQYLGAVYNNGLVEVSAKQQVIETWCNEGSSNWPWDDLKCSVDFAIHGADINLVYDSEPQIRTERMTESTEWRLTDIKISTEHMNIKQKLWIARHYAELVNTDLSLKLSMKRNNLFYREVFYTPLVVSAFLIILSFSLTGFKRGLMNLIAFNLLLIGFVVLAQHTPVTYVPKITHIYEAFLAIVCFSYYLHILNRWLTVHPPESEPPAIVKNFINFSPLRIILLIQFSDATEYLSIQKSPWREISIILDRIFSVIFIVMFAIVLGVGY